MMLLVDRSLSQRLERAEAAANAAFVEARARLAPESGAAWIDVAGTYAMFDGVASPVTQTFGLGLFASPTDEDLTALEAFFIERGAPVHHEVSPIALVDLMPRLTARGYRPVELTTILFQELPRAALPATIAPDPGLRVRVITPGEGERWAQAAADGWNDVAPELREWMLALGRVNAQRPDTQCFIAELDGMPVATGALSMSGGVAVLAGASTIPSARGRGAQGALLHARLDYAASQGCDLALMGASPGSPSQRNAERQGFRIAYTRIKWRR